jgi:hypothetical protein
MLDSAGADLISSAYFIYHERPTAVRISPAAGPFTGNTVVTVAVQGVFDSYRGCLNGPGNNEEALPIGWPRTYLYLERLLLIPQEAAANTVRGCY